MPNNQVKTPAQEKKWDEAKSIVKKEYGDEKWPIVTHIYQNMKKHSSANLTGDLEEDILKVAAWKQAVLSDEQKAELLSPLFNSTRKDEEDARAALRSEAAKLVNPQQVKQAFAPGAMMAGGAEFLKTLSPIAKKFVGKSMSSGMRGGLMGSAAGGLMGAGTGAMAGAIGSDDSLWGGLKGGLMGGMAGMGLGGAMGAGAGAAFPAAKLLWKSPRRFNSLRNHFTNAWNQGVSAAAKYPK